MERVKLKTKFDISELTTGPFDFVGKTYRYENGQLLEYIRVPCPGLTGKGKQKSKSIWKEAKITRGIFALVDFRDPEQAIEHYEELLKLVKRKKAHHKQSFDC